MTAERATSLIVAMGLHACALWLLKPGEYQMAQMAGEPEGPTVNVELVEATAPEDAPVVETPPEPTPPPEPEPPEVIPPEPTPTPEPPPPQPDEMEEPTQTPPEPKPQPKPKPKPKPRPVTQPASKPGPPTQASPAPTGFRGAAARGSAKGDKGAELRTKPYVLYPSRLKEMGVEPRAVILVVVSAEGKVASARLFQSSGYSDWDQAALKAVREARFDPKTVMGIAVQDTVRVPITGNLLNR